MSMALHYSEISTLSPGIAHRGGGHEQQSSSELQGMAASPSGACRSHCCDTRRHAASRQGRWFRLLLASLSLLVLTGVVLLLVMGGARSLAFFQGRLGLPVRGHMAIMPSSWTATAGSRTARVGDTAVAPCQQQAEKRDSPSGTSHVSGGASSSSSSSTPPAQRQLLATVWGFAGGLHTTSCGCGQKLSTSFLGGDVCSCIPNDRSRGVGSTVSSSSKEGGTPDDRRNGGPNEECSIAATREMWGMLLVTAASPAELLLPPPQQPTPLWGSSSSGSRSSGGGGAAGWKPFLTTVPELVEQAPANSARILAATAAFAQKLQLLAAASPGAASAGLSLGPRAPAPAALTRLLRQVTGGTGPAAVGVQDQPESSGAAGTSADWGAQQLQHELNAFVGVIQREFKSIEVGTRATAVGISQVCAWSACGCMCAQADCALAYGRKHYKHTARWLAGGMSWLDDLH